MAEERKKSRRSFKSLPRRAQNAAFASMRASGKIRTKSKRAKNAKFNQYIDRNAKNMYKSRKEQAIANRLDVKIKGGGPKFKSKKETSLYQKIKKVNSKSSTNRRRSEASDYLNRKLANVSLGRIYSGLITNRSKGK